MSTRSRTRPVEYRISRRSFLSFLGGAVATAPMGPPLLISAAAHARPNAPTQPIHLSFQMFWRRRNIGTHRISVWPAGEAGSWRVESVVDLKARHWLVGEIIFKYRGEEVWRDGRIVELRSATDDNGEVYSLSGQVEGSDFALNGPAGPYWARGSLLTTNSLWTEAVCAQGELIDAKNGGVIGVVAEKRGVKTVETNTGGTTARAYDVVSPLLAGEFWFNAEGILIGGVIKKSGQEVKYVAQS